MGRNYYGDINGKMWFGVQPSDDPDFFGVQGQQPSVLEYSFTEEDIPSIEKGILECKKKVLLYKRRLDVFFSDHDGYNDEMIMEVLGLSKQKAKEALEWYARLELGNRILECVKATDWCCFTVEC